MRSAKQVSDASCIGFHMVSPCLSTKAHKKQDKQLLMWPKIEELNRLAICVANTDSSGNELCKHQAVSELGDSLNEPSNTTLSQISFVGVQQAVYQHLVGSTLRLLHTQ